LREMIRPEELKRYFLKYREIISYLFFGGLAFVVSIATYYVFADVFGINELLANILSWIITVLFAFFTNRIWVFQSKVETLKAYLIQLVSFFGGRVATLIIEELILLIFVTWLHFDGLVVKICAQVVVIVLNYILSKMFIFR